MGIQLCTANASETVDRLQINEPSLLEMISFGITFMCLSYYCILWMMIS